MWGAVWIWAAALAGAMWIESTLWALGIWLASQIAITTPAMAMIWWTLAWESFQENLSRLWNFDMWKESALYNTILTLVSPVVWALKQSILIGKLGKWAASMKWANFVLKSFNLAKFAGDVWLTVAMDTLIFDGEFTPQELVNATIFALVNRASNIRRVVKNWEKIDFESMWKALWKSKSDIGDKPRQRTRPIEVPENYRILELENLTLEKIKSNTDSQNVKIVKRVELLKRDLELLKREIDLSWNKDKIPEYEYKQNLLSKTEKLLEKSLWVDDFSYIKEQNILNSLDPVTRQNIETLNMLAKDIDSIFCKDLKQKDADTHSQMWETMKKYWDKLEMFKNMMWDRYNELLHLLQKPVSETDMRKFEEKIIPLKQEINDLTARWVVPTDPKLARRQEELNRELYLLRNKYGEKRVAEFLQSLNQRLDKQFKAEKQWTNEKSKENIGYRILELENLTVEQIKLNTDAQNMKIVERLDLLKQDIKSLEKQVKSWDKSKQMELLYKKSLAARTESLIKETFGEENINYIKMKNKLNSLGKTVKDDLNYLNALTLTMDRLLFEHLHTVFEKGDNLDNSYIFGENGMSNKLYIYNKKLENFKKTLGSDFNEVSQFLLNPIYGKDIKLLEKDIPALKQTINILNMLKTPANNPQMVAKQRELNNHIDNLKRSYGSKRVEDLMHLIDQRVYKTNTRASWQQSQEQWFGNSYRAKVERPKEAQKTQAQTERERVDRISRLSLQKIKDDMLILKRDIEKIYGSDKSRWDIEVEINECKTTLQQAEKAFNENNFSKGTRFFELWTKRIEDLQKSLTNVYDKVQDYFVYTARLKEIWLSNDLKDLTLDNNSVNPARFKQFMNEVSWLKDKTQQIQKLADKAGNVKSWENRIYAWY